MVYLSELLPNPAGTDAGNEWIELCNNDPQAQSLAGWKLQDASGKTFTISNVSVAPQSCIVLGNAETKISLNNDTETVLLLDSNGAVVDRVSYSKAKDDQAFARIGTGGELQMTTTPTKGMIGNVITAPVAKAIPPSRYIGTTEGTAKIPVTTNVEIPMEVSEQKTIVSGTTILESILIGICVAGVLAAVFVRITMRLRWKSENKNIDKMV